MTKSDPIKSLELLVENCPFCGREANIYYRWNGTEGFTAYGVNCIECAGRTG